MKDIPPDIKAMFFLQAMRTSGEVGVFEHVMFDLRRHAVMYVRKRLNELQVEP